MQMRTLGSTGEQVSILGMGGFHLLEIGTGQANQILNQYLDEGGNYIETSASYGHGESERKIGRAVDNRRREFLLGTKVDERDRKGAMQTLEQSLRNLWTDVVDIWFMHAVQTEAEAEKLLGPDGALEAAEQAKKQGKIRFVGISGHGQPFGLLRALQETSFDVIMVPINYYDRFNFPDVHNKLIPLVEKSGTAVMGMKALADGYLWHSAEEAFRYAWSQPVCTVVAGCNTPRMLDQDVKLARSFSPLTEQEIQDLHASAPEYREYVCRQCESCLAGDKLNLKRIFELEGWYDRQMWDGVVRDPEDYALRMRLGPWFGQQDAAMEAFAAERLLPFPQADFGHLKNRCPYIKDLEKKLRIARKKLTSPWALR
jgi:predicted aldo/keto reductase-like oxidoreductase